MNPNLVPWLLCGALCLIPACVGTGAFFAWCQFTNKFPSRIIYEFMDDDKRKHVITEWVMLTREERKMRNKPEEEE